MRITRSILPLLFCLSLAGIFLAGCRAASVDPTATPTAAPTQTATATFPLPEGKIIFSFSETRKFAGMVYGHGETAILLANMSYGGQRQWDPFIEAFDRTRFTAVTFDYLQPDYSGASQAAGLVLKTLRASGYTRIVCFGASLGVTACGSLSTEPEIVGIVMVAGPNYGGTMRNLAFPKLFIAGADDEWSQYTRLVYEAAGDPKDLVIYEGVWNHGTELFDSTVREQFLQLLIDFVNDLP